MTLTAPVRHRSGTPEPPPAAARPGPPAPGPSPGLTTRTRHADEVHGEGGWSSPPEATNPAHPPAGRQPIPSHRDTTSDTKHDTSWPDLPRGLAETLLPLRDPRPRMCLGLSRRSAGSRTARLPQFLVQPRSIHSACDFMR